MTWTCKKCETNNDDSLYRCEVCNEPNIDIIHKLEEKIKFTVSSNKIVRNTGTVVVKWSVPFKADVFLQKGTEPESCANSGQCSMTLSESVTIKLIIQIEKDIVRQKELRVEAFDESEILFTADKEYTLPSVPVVLSWEVKHAKKVWLDGKIVAAVGNKVVEIEHETSFKLKVKDEFGTKIQTKTIRLLPIPQIRALLIDTPNLKSNIALTIKHPKFRIQPSLPTINLGFVKTEVPKVPSLTDLGIAVELNSHRNKLNHWRPIRRISVSLNALRKKLNFRRAIINIRERLIVKNELLKVPHLRESEMAVKPDRHQEKINLRRFIKRIGLKINKFRKKFCFQRKNNYI